MGFVEIFSAVGMRNRVFSNLNMGAVLLLLK
jgi:hypothetical protein